MKTYGNMSTLGPAINQAVLTCPICRANGRRCGNEGVLTYYQQCSSCDTVWLKDRSRYNNCKKDIYDERYVQQMNSPEGIKRYRRLAEHYFHLLNFLSSSECSVSDPPRKFIEIGFSIPSVITYFYRFGYEVTALDIHISQKTRDFLAPLVASGRFHFSESDFEAWESVDTFDILWMSHVLEHLEKPDRALSKIAGMLKKTGVAFVSSPDAECARELGPQSLVGHMHPEEHLFMYSIATFKEMCESAGLKVVYFERYGDPIPDCFEFVTKMEWRAVIMHKEFRL